MDKQLTPQVQQDLLMVWKFIRDYSFVINVRPVPLGELVGCIALGVESKYLADLHMSMLKLLLADVEGLGLGFLGVGQECYALGRLMLQIA